MTEEQPRVVLDPALLRGKPVVRGTRLSVEFVVGLLAGSLTARGDWPGHFSVVEPGRIRVGPLASG
jgi:Protein of unknown function (DUF433)